MFISARKIRADILKMHNRTGFIMRSIINTTVDFIMFSRNLSAQTIGFESVRHNTAKPTHSPNITNPRTYPLHRTSSKQKVTAAATMKKSRSSAKTAKNGSLNDNRIDFNMSYQTPSKAPTAAAMPKVSRS